MYLEVTSTYHTKVDVPNSVTCLIRTSIFECYVVWYGFKSGYRKDWTVAQENDNHLRLDSQHNWADLYDHLMSTEVFTLIAYRTFIRAPKTMGKMTPALIWICYLIISYASCVSYSRRSELVRKCLPFHTHLP